MWVKQRASLLIECKEMAMNELKYQNNLEINRLTMILHDVESRLCNDTVSEDEIEEILNRKVKLQNMADCISRI